MEVRWSERYPGVKCGVIENVPAVAILQSEVIVYNGYKNGNSRHFTRDKYLVEVKETK
jgi:hypothetical protein